MQMEVEVRTGWRRNFETALACKSGVEKAKAQVELECEKDIKINLNSYCNSSSNSLDKENLVPLLNGVCDVVTVDCNNSFFASVFTNEVSLASELSEGIQGELLSVDKDQAKITWENLAHRNIWEAMACSPRVLRELPNVFARPLSKSLKHHGGRAPVTGKQKHCTHLHKKTKEPVCLGWQASCM